MAEDELCRYGDKFKDLYDAVPEGKVFRIAYDAALQQMRILSRSSRCIEEVREVFSVENASAFFTKQFGYTPEKRIYAINKFGYFEAGLVFEVLEWIKTQYGGLSAVTMSKSCLSYINDVLCPLKKLLTGKEIKIENVADMTGRNAELAASSKPPYEWRQYQKNAVEALLLRGFGRGLIEIPTSGGKSFILANFIWNVHKLVDPSYKVMIFVPNVQLVSQFYKDLVDYGYDSMQLAKFCGNMSARERKQNDVQRAKIIIANRQYVYSNKSMLPKVDVLVVDEVHQASAKSSMRYILSSDAKIKVGCTGTLPKEMNRLWELYGMFGRVVYREDVNDLQAQGFISKLKITLLDIFLKKVEKNHDYLFNLRPNQKYKPDEFGNSDVLFNEAFTAEQDFYAAECEMLYTPVMKYLSTLDENVLVLFDRLEIGRGMFEIAKREAPGKAVHYIDGATPVEEREKVRSGCETSGNNIIVGNVSILGTGINIKRLSHIVFLCNTKSSSRVIQSIGRTLRLHHMKREAHLVDVVYNMKYSVKHYRERADIYKTTYRKKKPDETIRITVD